MTCTHSPGLCLNTAEDLGGVYRALRAPEGDDTSTTSPNWRGEETREPSFLSNIWESGARVSGPLPALLRSCLSVDARSPVPLREGRTLTTSVDVSACSEVTWSCRDVSVKPILPQ